MVQISVKNNTYVDLNILRTDGVVAREGQTVSWDAVISSLIQVAQKNKEDYLEVIKTKLDKGEEKLKSEEKKNE